MIVRRSIRFTRAHASEEHSLRSILQHQWPAIVRIAGRGTGSARVYGKWNGLSIDEAIPAGVARAGDEDRLIELPGGPQARHMSSDIARGQEKVCGDLSLNTQVPLLNSGHLDIKAGRELIIGKRSRGT